VNASTSWKTNPASHSPADQMLVMMSCHTEVAPSATRLARTLIGLTSSQPNAGITAGAASAAAVRLGMKAVV